MFKGCNIQDDNPFHINPSQSKVVHFDVSILHGIWTLWIITRTILQKKLIQWPKYDKMNQQYTYLKFC